MTGEPGQQELKPALHLVGLLDLLGYTQLVEEFLHNPAVIQGVEKVFSTALEMVKGMQTAQLGKSSVEWNTIAKKIKFHLISDTALITMPVTGLHPLSGTIDVGESRAVLMESFLNLVALFCLLIAGRLGYFFRGGIALGEHYEKNLLGGLNLFMFSQALIDANKLVAEEKKRHTPRILAGESMFRFLGQHGGGSYLQDDGWVFEDDGSMILNIYRAIPLQPKTKGTTEPLLSGIGKELLAGFRKHGHKDDVAAKYRWFISHHNRQVSERFGRPDLKVDVSQ